MPTSLFQLNANTPRRPFPWKAIAQSYAIGTMLVSSILWSAPAATSLAGSLSERGLLGPQLLLGSGALYLLAIYGVNLLLTTLGVVAFVHVRPVLARSPWLAAFQFALFFFIVGDVGRVAFGQLNAPLPWNYVALDLANNLAWSVVTFQVAAHSLYRGARASTEVRPAAEKMEDMS